MQYILRNYQEAAVQTGINSLEKKKDNDVIVLPTGAGKSIVIGKIADNMAGHTLVLQPSKEILEQNYTKLSSLGRDDIAMYSASIGVKRIDKITLATIGSIYKKPEIFDQFEQILVDECDLVNAKEGMYKSFFEAIQRPVLGFTASPWRMQPGYKIPNKRGQYTGSVNKIITRTRPKVFNDLAHITQIKELYDQGFLCPLDYVQGHFDQGALALNTTGNDYTDASFKRISHNVIKDAVAAAMTRKAKSTLIFTKFVEDAVKIVAELENYGLRYTIVTGDTKDEERDRVIRGLKSGQLDGVANVGVLTVGFDHPGLDHIILARATNSTRLYYQMGGRGFRIHPDKEFCTFTDLCGNVDRMGKFEDWQIRDDNGNKKYRLFNKNKPLTGIDLKTGIDLENTDQTGQPRDLNVIHFGKYKGYKMSAVPSEYLYWIRDNFSNGSFKNQALDELTIRTVRNV